MRYRIETWTIDRLIQTHQSQQLSLEPPYQRMFIWSKNDQRTLINSINHGYPVPSIFLREVSAGYFEMVDGQQRTRTILGFIAGTFDDFEGQLYSIQGYPSFLQYILSVIIIEEIAEDDISIEEFYALVNSSGVHLNRPEVKKAAHYDTRFLELLTNCNDYPSFKELNLFADAALKRMNDVDFVSELVVQLKNGITDKKETVDRTFESDITEVEYTTLLAKFQALSDAFSRLNRIYLIRKTRWRQRNDFYTMFGFLDTVTLMEVQQDYFYKILVLIGTDITPSNEECIPFQEYARNCVTQSNSRVARTERRAFLQALFMNETNQPNSVQREILSYYDLRDYPLHQIGNTFTLDLNALQAIKPSITFS